MISSYTNIHFESNAVQILYLLPSSPFPWNIFHTLLPNYLLYLTRMLYCNIK